MQKRPITRGRPAGSTTFEKELARALGDTVLARREGRQMGQETLANVAGIERSHMGKIERGLHVPTLPLIFRIARALDCNAAALVADVEQRLAGPRAVPPMSRSPAKRKAR